MRKKRMKFGMTLLVISTLSVNLLTGCGTQTVSALPPSAVSIQKVQLAQMPSGEAYLGTVTPYVQTLIAPSLSGILSSVKVRVGDKVETGQLLATLNTDILNAQMNQALANQGLAAAQKDAATQKLDSGQNQAKSGLDAAQTNLANAKAGAETNIAASQRTYDALRTQLDNQVAAAEKALNAAQAQLSNVSVTKENAVDQTGTAVASANSNLTAIKNQAAAILAADQANINALTTALQQASAQLDQAKQAGDTTAIATAQSAYNQLNLSLENAKGKLSIDQASTGVTAGEAALQNAQAALAAAQNSDGVYAAQAQVDQTTQALANAKATRESELTKAQATLEAAKTSVQNGVNGATAQLAQAQAAYEGLLGDQQLKVNDAQLAAAQAGVQTMEVQIDKGRLTSPLSGYVVAVNAQAGQAVGPQGGFIMISSVKPLIATVEVPESSIAKIKKDMDMNVLVSATRETLQGKVSAIHPTPDSMNRKYLVEIELEDNKGELLAGMRVEAYVVNEGTKGMLIPSDSVVTLKSGAYSVFVVKDGVAHNQIVKVGEMTGAFYEVTEGLSEDQDLVVQGQNLLSEGDKVQIVTDRKAGK